MTVAFPHVRVGEPVSYQSLAVFPLFAEDQSGVDYLLADEALAENELSVEEVSETGSVPDLLVDNRSGRRVLFIEGEELVGAKQNRILNASLLVPAHSKMKIPVSCVEQGRWGYKTKFFGSSGSHSPSKLRHAMKASVTHSLKAKQGHRCDQGAVWNEVGELHSAMQVKSATGAMSDAFDAYEDRLAEFRKQLQYVEGASGMAVTVAGKVVGYDLFDKPATCRKVWDRLLSGLVFDALSAKSDGGSVPEVGASDVQELLATCEEAAWERAEPVGEGEEYRAEFDDGEVVSALTFEDSLVHGSALVAR